MRGVGHYASFGPAFNAFLPIHLLSILILVWVSTHLILGKLSTTAAFFACRVGEAIAYDHVHALPGGGPHWDAYANWQVFSDIRRRSFWRNIIKTRCGRQPGNPLIPRKGNPQIGCATLDIVRWLMVLPMEGSACAGRPVTRGSLRE